MEMLNPQAAAVTQLLALMAYSANLELEVDRLRWRDQSPQQEAAKHVQRILRAYEEQSSPAGANPLAAIAADTRQFRALLLDLSGPPIHRSIRSSILPSAHWPSRSFAVSNG